MLSFSDPNPIFPQNQSEGGNRSSKTLTSFGFAKLAKQPAQTVLRKAVEDGTCGPSNAPVRKDTLPQHLRVT